MFRRSSARFFASSPSPSRGRFGTSVRFVGTKSCRSFRQPGGTGRSGAGVRLGREGVRPQTSAPSRAIVSATIPTAPREMPRLFSPAPFSVELDFVEDIRMDALQGNAAGDHLHGNGQRHARGGQTGVFVTGLVGQLSLDRVLTGRDTSRELQQRAHRSLLLIDRQTLVGELELLELSFG